MAPSTSSMRIAAAATLAGSIIGHAAAQSGPYTVSDSTTTRTYTVTQGVYIHLHVASEKLRADLHASRHRGRYPTRFKALPVSQPALPRRQRRWCVYFFCISCCKLLSSTSIPYPTSPHHPRIRHQVRCRCQRHARRGGLEVISEAFSMNLQCSVMRGKRRCRSIYSMILTSTLTPFLPVHRTTRHSAGELQDLDCLFPHSQADLYYFCDFAGLQSL